MATVFLLNKKAWLYQKKLADWGKIYRNFNENRLKPIDII
jgi:hypothetical protein